MRPTLALLAAALLAAPSYPQLQPGTFLATLQGSTSVRGVHVVDRFTNKTTKMTINGINWSNAVPVRTFIENANNFLLLVATGSARVFRVTWTNGAWQATRLTTTDAPLPAFDITRIGTTIYIAQSSKGNTAKDARIWQLPSTGGAATSYLPLGPNVVPTNSPSVVGQPRMVAVGTTLHIFMWDAPNTTAGGEHISVDTTATTPAFTRRGRLPMSKGWCKTQATLPRQACFDPASGLIVIGMRNGNVVWRHPTGITVRHDVVQTVTGTCPAPLTQQGQSLAVNTDTGAVLFGDRAGSMEEKLCFAGTWQLNVQTVVAGTAVDGLEYFPSGSLYRHAGNGCPQTNGQIACNYVTSLPIRGTKTGLTVRTPAQNGYLIIGAKNQGISLAPYGAPGCLLGPTINVLVPVTRTGTGFTITFPVPKNLPKGIQAYTQWAIRDNVNPFGFVTSDTRLIKP